MNLTTIAYAAAIALAGFAVYLAWRGTAAAADAAGSALNAVNPLNNNNVFAQGADSLVKTVSGGRYLSAGDAAYNFFNSDNAGAIASAPSVPSNVVSLADYFQSVENDDQAAAGWISNAGGAATGRTRMKR